MNVKLSNTITYRGFLVLIQDLTKLPGSLCLKTRHIYACPKTPQFRGIQLQLKQKLILNHFLILNHA